jgi:hypothetical protein
MVYRAASRKLGFRCRSVREPIGARRILMVALKRVGFAKVGKLTNLEDGGNTFLRNTGELISGYMTSHARK